MSHRVRWRGRRPDSRSLDLLDGADPFAFADDEVGWLGGLAIALTVVLLLALSVFLVFPAVIFAIEVLVLVLLVGGAVVARVVFRRPWTIEAVPESGGQATRLPTWQAVGWTASGRLIDRVSHDIATGRDPRL